jgi:uncharacterized membrane protein
MRNDPVRPKQPAITGARTRLQNIDALRGFVMVVMLLDHIRETWFLHVPVTDPMDALSADPWLFFTRLSSSLCAPVFVALTGLGAYLFSRNHSRAETQAFLVKRGLFLIGVELILITPAWTVKLPPTIWLQVIWCIGICMITLAGLMRLPRRFLIALGLAIMCGHNLFDGIRLTPDHPLFALWAILHQRDLIALPFGAVARTSYPILPWIGVILLGFGIGPWFDRGFDAAVRQRRLLILGFGLIAGFVALRWLNLYGDAPWYDGGTPLRTFMSFIALTKYPPSLLFLSLTLGVGAILLVALERAEGKSWLRVLAIFGGAPMFFYILHIYVLRALYHILYAIWGPTQGSVFGVGHLGWIWAWYAALLVPLYFPTAWYSRLKARRKDVAWLKYL